MPGCKGLGQRTHITLCRVSAGLDDLLGGLSVNAAAAPPPAAPTASDPFDMFGAAPSSAATTAAAHLPVLVSGEKGKGLTISGRLRRSNGQAVYQLSIANASGGAVDGFMLQVNNNSFGLAPADQVVSVGSLAPGTSNTAQVVMTYNPAKHGQGPVSTRLQVGQGQLTGQLLGLLGSL